MWDKYVEHSSAKIITVCLFMNHCLWFMAYFIFKSHKLNLILNASGRRLAASVKKCVSWVSVIKFYYYTNFFMLNVATITSHEFQKGHGWRYMISIQYLSQAGDDYFLLLLGKWSIWFTETLFYVSTMLFQKGDTIQGGRLFKEIRYMRIIFAEECTFRH